MPSMFTFFTLFKIYFPAIISLECFFSFKNYLLPLFRPTTPSRRSEVDAVLHKLEGIRTGGRAGLDEDSGRAGEDIVAAGLGSAAGRSGVRESAENVRDAIRAATAAKTAAKARDAPNGTAPLESGQKIVQNAARNAERRQREELMLKRRTVENAYTAREQMARSIELAASSHSSSLQAVATLNGIQVMMGAQIILEHKKARIDIPDD